jgi:ABC-2 type transport system permease protein
MKSWIAFWNILMKDMKNYYLKPPNISWGIIIPLAWTLMFFIKTGRSPEDVRSLLPGIMAMAILFGTTSVLAVTITFERKNKSFERLLLAPIGPNLLMFAKTSGAILFGFVNAFVPVAIAAFMTDLSGIRWLPVIGGVAFIAVTSTFLGLFISVSVSEVFEAQTFSNFFRFPMIFLCGLFVPIADLPVFLRPLSYVLPLTYGADILNTAVNQQGHLPLWISFFALIGFALFLFGFSVRNVKRKWIM